MVASFEAACLEAALNEPFKTRTEFGWHVVEVLEFGSQRGVISPEDFAEVYRDPEQRKRYQLIDVREPGELEIVSLDDFMNLPLNEYSRWRHLVEGNPDQAPALDPSRPVIVMCHHGIRSATMCAYLCQQGFKDVLNLLGGIDAYAVQIDPSLRRY
jgi:rhodanese-related sulfurtransferase